MSEEEKEAIKYLEFLSNEKCECEACQHAKKEYKIILNLLDKQQKEIEEKNCLIDVLQHRIEELLDNKKEINYIKPIDIPVHNYINEDKIREKIKELEDNMILFTNDKEKFNKYKYARNVLEELLEEK